MEVLNNQQLFNCERCPWGKHCDETNPAPINQWVIKDAGIESNVCFLPMVTQREIMFHRLYGHYRSGILYSSGGIREQQNVYLEAMEVIDLRVKQIEASHGNR